MKQQKQGGKVLPSLLIAFLAFAVIGIFAVHCASLRKEARTLVRLDTLRGLTQRIIHLELSGKNTLPLIDQADLIFASAPESARNEWEGLKADLRRYHTAAQVEQALIATSITQSGELIWQELDPYRILGHSILQGRQEWYWAIVAAAGTTVILFLVLFSRHFTPSQKYRQPLRDEQTGCYSRNYFYTKLQSEITRAERYELPLSLIIFDIDHFRQLNEAYGRTVGDGLLKRLANLVASLLRDSDTFGRTGGEEFAVVVPHTDENSTAVLAEKLRGSIEGFPFDLPMAVTCSFGITSFKKGESWQDFFSRADEGLILAKQEGRNRVSIAV
jgi:diguanylate cyclase (GGDEF)-like protein